MERKKLTIFITGNHLDRTYKLVLSSARVKATLIIGSIMALAIVAGMVDYGGLLIQAAENKRLRFENAQLMKQLQLVEGKVTTLESSIERIRTFTTKLKLITNIDTEDRSLNLAMGAQPAPNSAVDEYDQAMDQRPPLEELEKQEGGLAEPKPVNSLRGELATEEGRDYKTLAVRIDRTLRDAQLREQSVLDLWEALSERQSLLLSTPNIKPARGWITSRFGYRISPFTSKPTLHAGLDIAAAPGSPVFAPADGVVTFAGYDEGYGKMVTLDHGYGVTTRYGHCSQVYVQVGQKVSRYDVIASVGNTGRSTGPHLHYEVRVNGVPRNPALYILDE